ncbi:2-isopropylmalate synthase [uncultured archaeon]|nr:2-isopropylmalate synthase [uncultured archaeon]
MGKAQSMINGFIMCEALEMRKIKIFDTTLRDGEQSPGCTMTMEDKLKIAKKLEALNVDVIEAGFPIASPGDFQAVSEVAKEIKGPVIAGLARCTKEDIDACWKAIQHAKNPRIHIFLATSPIHMQYKLKKTPGEVIEDAVAFTKYAANYCRDVEFSPEDASRTKPEFLYEIVEKVIAAGATTVNIPDTVGYSIPSEFGRIIKGIKDNVPNVNNAAISVHCHNDLGLAVANSIAAIENGADQVECTINGIGERAGNASLEEVVMAIETRKKHLDVCTGIVPNHIYPISRLVSTSTGMIVQRNKAIVGDNAFAHEAGIHQHGVLSHPLAYEIMNPEKIGRESVLVIGKHSGKHAIGATLKKMCYELTDEHLTKITELVKAHADKRKIVDEEDLRIMANHVTHKENGSSETIKIDKITVLTGNNITPTATVKFSMEGKEKIITSIGNGPIDAIANAFVSVVPDMKIADFEVRSVGTGSNATAQVLIKFMDNNKKLFSIASCNDDTLMASANAFAKGANRILSSRNGV